MSFTSRDALSLHASTLVIDCHADTPQRFTDEAWDFADSLRSAHSTGHLNLAAARRGNLAGEFFALWVDPAQYGPELYVQRTLDLLHAVRDQVVRHPAELALCTTPEEILAAREQRRFCMLLGIEGGHAIGKSLTQLRTYFNLGVRYLTLTWANSNEWAESSSDLRRPDSGVEPGLTPLGREVVAEMNRLGMMIDVSHSSDRTLDDVLTVTRAPILATHSSARALCDSPRNLTDDQLRRIAAQGGAIMVNFYSAFVDENFRQSWNAIRPEREAAHHRLREEFRPGTPIPFHIGNQIERQFAARIPRPPLASLMAHFDHIIEVAGIDHVGIGTDFDGISSLPQEIDSASDLPKITAALLERGHSEADVRKVLGENLMRVLAAVQREAVHSVPRVASSA